MFNELDLPVSWFLANPTAATNTSCGTPQQREGMEGWGLLEE